MIPQPLFDCRSLQEIQFTSGDEIPTNGLTLTQVMIQIYIYIYIYIGLKSILQRENAKKGGEDQDDCNA